MFGYEIDAPVVSAVASTLSACAAVGGVLFAAIKGSKELDRWRAQQRHAKRAEVAGQALATTLRYLSTLERATTPAVMEPKDDHHWRLTAIDAVAPDFERAFELALTYLPESANAILEQVSELGRTIRWAHMNLADAPQGHESDLTNELRREGYSRKPRTQELREQARSALRPLAQLTGDD